MTTLISLLMTGATRPEEALKLPKGRLKIGEFTVEFSPEQVLDAAEAIVMYFERGEGLECERTFVSQAGVIAYRAEELGAHRLAFATY